MNHLLNILLVVSLVRASPSPQVVGIKNIPRPPTPQPKFPIDPPKSINMVARNGLITSADSHVWNSIISRLLQLRRGVKIRNVISIKFDDTPPPPPSTTRATTTTTARVGSGARFLGFRQAIPPPGLDSAISKRPSSTPTARALISSQKIPITGDIGACSTIVKSAERINEGYLYFPRGSANRKVTLYQALATRDIECRFSNPPQGSGNEECVVVGYPHGAWVRATQADMAHHNRENCFAIANSSDMQCWDYIIVPGYCVLKKNR
uniref:uncharacterized protein LOC120325670 n=1 Tax=Styela clava TaxID=7725 RepID=UPI00193AB4EB|nr:uncharacterized protein LOC120325670 [Styela clava]